jgi:protein-disulfide isomerase-like protein with CxxC motif
MGADSFPSLVLERDGARRLLQFDYLDPEVVLRQLES